MATKPSRPITRETADHDASFHRPLMISIDPASKFLTIWTKRSRSPYRVKYSDIYRLGLHAYARARIEEKQQRRKKCRRV